MHAAYDWCTAVIVNIISCYRTLVQAWGSYNPIRYNREGCKYQQFYTEANSFLALMIVLMSRRVRVKSVNGSFSRLIKFVRLSSKRVVPVGES